MNAELVKIGIIICEGFLWASGWSHHFPSPQEERT